MSSAATIGCMGKLPLFGDFVRLNGEVSPGLAVLDRWLTLGNRQTIAHIKAGLNRQHHAFAEVGRLLAKPVSADIVHIQTKPVTGSMHVEVAVVTTLDHAVGIAAEQTEIDQTFHQLR